MALTIVAAGCAGGEPEGETMEVGPDSLTIAQEAFDAAAFDTITWETDTEAEERGAVVYQYSCRKCHGERGLGDAEFVRQGDTLRPPSFREPDWGFASDLDGLREQVFVGNAEGMPHWGLVGLKPKDVDAVAKYILNVLREG
jgi:mono/diheme cytochrome c family protein